jgi:MFS family permease
MAEEAASSRTAPLDGDQKLAPLASLSYRDFRLLWGGMPFSQTGQWMRNTVNAWQVYQISDSSTLLGLTFLFQGLPSIVLGLFGGTLADLLDRRRLVLATQAGQVALALVLGFLTASGAIEVWHIYALTFGASTLASVEAPARMALLPRLVPRSHLLNATTLQATATQASLLAGPVLGGLIISGPGPSTAYFVNAAMVVPALIAVFLVVAPPLEPQGKVRLNIGAIFEGLTFSIKTQVLIAFLLLDMVTMVLGYYPAMMPVFAKDILQVGPTGLGMLLSAPAFGAVIGFIALLFIGDVRHKGALILAVTLIHALVLALFAISSWFLLSLLMVTFLGLLDSMSVAVRQTSFQLLAPEQVRGRVMSMVTIFAVGSNSLGGAYLGLTTSLMGPRSALGTGALVAGSFGLLVAMLWRRVREFKV